MSSTSALATSAKSIAKVTATIVGNAGAVISTSLPAAPTATKAASASILDPSHPDPTKFDVSDPIVLFIIQAALIVGISRLLQFGLRRLRQPRVISEIVGGIILGPSAFGRIPHFTAHIFPSASLPYLNLVSTIGLVLFLFLVGLEVDFSVFRRGVRASASISLVGIVVPFALGAAVSVGLYDKYIDASTVKFGTFLLFIGTAYGITAFPVLARILTELNLLQDPLGVTVLAAGVGNDVIGWILLALSVALVNASSGIIVLYVILCAIGWILVLWFIARPLLVFACRKSGAFGEKGPSQSIICAVVFLVLTSAWVTDRIGIHAIFGGFVVGLIVPTPIRAALTEKIEDLVSVLFLPIYFALSGLKTDLGLLKDGSIWGWTICIVLVAFLSKFLSCGIMAKLNGMNWRESGAVGSLMACKGLVELIVLNIGLSAGILNNQVFAQFVFMALVTTFATTPLTLLFYPTAYRQRLAHDNVGESTISPAGPFAGPGSLKRFTIVLRQFEDLPTVFAFCKLVTAPVQFDLLRSPSTSDEKSEDPLSPPLESPVAASSLTVSALRLVELSERTSAIINASDSLDKLVASDSLSQVFRAFAHGSGLATKSSIAAVSSEQFPDAVATHVEESSSDLVVLPWGLHGPKAEAGVIERMLPNPLEGIFLRGSVGGNQGAPQYASFCRRVFAEASCQVGLFFDRGVDASAAFSGRTHLFFAFHGGSDDRACLDLIVQLANRNPGVTATVVRVIPAPEHDLTEKGTRQSGGIDDDEAPIIFSQLTVHGGEGPTAVDTMYPTQNELTSTTADELSLALWFEPSSTPRTADVVDALARIDFSTISTVQPLHSSVLRAQACTDAHPDVPLVVVAGRGRKDAKSHQRELGAFLKENLDAVEHSIANSSEVRRATGDVAVAYLVAGCGTSLFVVQSARPGGAGKSKAV